MTDRLKRPATLALLGLFLVAVLTAATPADQSESLWDRAWDRVAGAAQSATSDESIADFIITSAGKQQRINRILRKKGSRLRVSDLTIVLGVAPALHVAVTEIPEAPPSPPVDP